MSYADNKTAKRRQARKRAKAGLSALDQISNSTSPRNSDPSARLLIDGSPDLTAVASKKTPQPSDGMSLAEVQLKIKLTLMNLQLEAAHRKYWKQEVDKCETEVGHLARMLKDPSASKTDIAVQQRLVNEYDQTVVKDKFLSAYNEVVKLEKILKMLRAREKEILRPVDADIGS